MEQYLRQWLDLQIASLPSRRAVTFGDSEVAQTRFSILDLAFVAANDVHGLFFGSRDL